MYDISVGTVKRGAAYDPLVLQPIYAYTVGTLLQWYVWQGTSAYRCTHLGNAGYLST